MKLPILNIKGENTGKELTLPEEIFGTTPNSHVLYLAVKQYLAHQRQGTSKSKDRSEVSGSTRKLFRQKGTGGARHGDINANIYVGGARAHGPRPRTYTLKLNKKVKTLARISALSAKAHAGQIVVVEDFVIDTPKTKTYLNFLKAIQADTKKPLHLMETLEENVYLSGRNLRNVAFSTAHDFNAYELLNTNCLIVSEKAITAIQAALAGDN
jgi:large subunit ribosomal protein L4